MQKLKGKGGINEPTMRGKTKSQKHWILSSMNILHRVGLVECCLYFQVVGLIAVDLGFLN